MNLKLALKVSLFLSLIFTLTLSAQTGVLVNGAVLQEGTKARVEQVEIFNMRSGQRVYSDKMGLFELISKPGDTLLAERIGYIPRKVVVKNSGTLVIRMQVSNTLKEVNVTGKLASQYFNEVATAYSKEKGIFYGGKPPIGLLSPFGGRPITFFYELLGKDGRRVRRLNQLAKQAAEAEEIDLRFNDMVIMQVVAIDSAELEVFKADYTPRLEKLKQWSAYERAAYIKASFDEFKKKR